MAFKEVYSKKYLAVIASVLVGIAAVIFAVSQLFVGADTPDAENAESVESPYGEPYTTLPTSEPYVEPPTAPPPVH
jgi:hypothetical protein